MTDPTAKASRRQGALLVADISGYTGFLQGVADAHRAILIEVDEPPQAYALVSSLLDTMVTVLAPPFELVKFEGDAVFAVATEDTGLPHGQALLTCLRSCYTAFTKRLGEARSEWTCSCGSCARIDHLDLKFVLHHGDYVAQRIAGREELLGPDVNVVHRLLKNHARDVLGSRPYALLSDAALESLEVPADEMLAMTETYDDVPPIPVHVLALA